MTVQQVIDSLQTEKQNGVASRFPCRAIIVKNIQQYIDLVSDLHQITDIQDISAAELFSSSDVMPKYENLTGPQYRDKWLILTGVSEYLLLFSKEEAINPRFSKLWSHQVDAQSKGRIIIPLWGCESQWHDPAIHLCDDIRQLDHYYNCIDEYSDESLLDILVLSDAFEQHVNSLESQERQMYIGLQEWFEYWQNPNATNNKLLLMTKRYSKIEPVLGNVSIQVISDSLSFVRGNLKGGEVLNKDNCDGNAVALLFDYALKGETVDNAILSALNTVSFSGTALMGQWNYMPEGKKQLVKLWYLLHPDDSYLCLCFRQNVSQDKLPDLILHHIFDVRIAHAEWAEEHRILVSSLNISKDAAYFDALDQIPDYCERLKYLTGRSKEERTYLLHMVGLWMRQDAKQVIACDELKQCYPELYAYLDGSSCHMSDELKGYFARYKAYKLENTLPADEEIYFAGISYDELDMRYSKLSEAIEPNSIILWIDALGAEWLPLLSWSLNTQCKEARISMAEVAQANLPTETCFNDQWKKMEIEYKKLDKLDKLAHKGIIDDPDYYACVEDQIAFISGIASEVYQLLKTHHRVVITGDHGTSRLAARFFHTREGMPATKEIKVCSHGRYCETTKDNVVISPDLVSVKCDGELRYQVFKNYDHFAQSGFAAGAEDDVAIYGEVHGGATPEEALVPVIVIDSLKAMPLSASWDKDTIKIMMKKIKPVINFNQPVKTLVAKIDDIDGDCVPNTDGTKWTITFAGATADDHKVTVVADGKILNMPVIHVKGALGNGSGDLL